MQPEEFEEHAPNLEDPLSKVDDNAILRAEDAEPVRPAEVMGYFKGLNYPADKQEIIAQAEDNTAPPNVLFIIEQMEDRSYTAPEDMIEMLNGMSEPLHPTHTRPR
jgi:hypothetical protein